MNNMLGIILRFRGERVAITGDIRKMYHAVKIPLLDQHTHQFLQRNLETDRPVDTYVMTSVSFGDKPAGCFAATALQKTAVMNISEFPAAANVVKNNKTPSNAEQLAKDVDAVLSTGGFAIKEWIIS